MLGLSKRSIRNWLVRRGYYVYRIGNEKYVDELNDASSFTVSSLPIRDKRPDTTFGESGEYDTTLAPEGLADVLGTKNFRGKRVLEIGPKWGMDPRALGGRAPPPERDGIR